jgi:hypothetical protein
MTTDAELERWQREWREHTDPLPELKKKIRPWQRYTDKAPSSQEAPPAWDLPAWF